MFDFNTYFNYITRSVTRCVKDVKCLMCCSYFFPSWTSRPSKWTWATCIHRWARHWPTGNSRIFHGIKGSVNTQIRYSTYSHLNKWLRLADVSFFLVPSMCTSGLNYHPNWRILDFINGKMSLKWVMFHGWLTIVLSEYQHSLSNLQ